MFSKELNDLIYFYRVFGMTIEVAIQMVAYIYHGKYNT